MNDPEAQVVYATHKTCRYSKKEVMSWQLSPNWKPDEVKVSHWSTALFSNLFADSNQELQLRAFVLRTYIVAETLLGQK